MEKLTELQNKIDELIKERDYYKSLLIKNNIDFSLFSSLQPSKLTKEEKISLYMDYFKGRSDVYAERWESTTKSGYSVVCINKFVKGKCDITNTKCQNCQNKELAKLDSNAIYTHLKGDKTLGIYPLLDDDTCYFLAVDFDDEYYEIEAVLFKKVCLEFNIDALIERSRSGNGAHVWMFFEDKFSSYKIRKIVTHILNTTINKYGYITLKSYDRMFPSQDKLSKNGIGNLIALPLNGTSGKAGNSLFVDNDFVPYNNQYEILKNTRKSKLEDLENLYKQIITQNPEEEILNYKKMSISNKDFNEDLIIIIKDDIEIAKHYLSNKALRYLSRMASFLNEKYYKVQNMRISTYNIPKIISVYKETTESIFLPRGCLQEIKELLTKLKVKYKIIDLEIKGTPLEVTFKGKLKESQQQALDITKKVDKGIIVAPTGFGKTVLAASIIASKKTNVLILVNNKNLCEQWFERLTTFLEKDVSIGIIHSTKKKITNQIDIALIQSLASKESKLELYDKYGMIILDEAHHAAAISYEQVLRKFKSKFMYGLTATPIRSDGFNKINLLTIGPIIYQYENTNLSYDKYLYPHFTKYYVEKNQNIFTLTEIENDLILNESRNNQIVDDVINALSRHRKILILTNRVQHINILSEKLKKYCSNILIIYGKMAKHDKEQFKQKISELKDEEFIIISTGKYIGEGFDESRLDTLFLTMPFKWKGTLTQYVGRLNRETSNKLSIEVHDYIDVNVPVLSKMYVERQKAYKKLNYFVINENNVNILYDNNTYIDTLYLDLKNAKDKIYFLIDTVNINILSDLIQKCSVKPIIYCSELIEIEEIKVVEKLGYNMIIIDNSIIWYGEINPFSKNVKELSIARIIDSNASKSIIEKIC